MSELYTIIKAHCEEQGVTIASMCKKAGVSSGLLSDLKMGRKKTVTLPTATKIANALNIPVETLLPGNMQQEKKEAPLSSAMDSREAMELLLIKEGILPEDRDLTKDEYDILMGALRGIVQRGKE